MDGRPDGRLVFITCMGLAMKETIRTREIRRTEELGRRRMEERKGKEKENRKKMMTKGFLVGCLAAKQAGVMVFGCPGSKKILGLAD